MQNIKETNLNVNNSELKSGDTIQSIPKTDTGIVKEENLIFNTFLNTSEISCDISLMELSTLEKFFEHISEFNKEMKVIIEQTIKEVNLEDINPITLKSNEEQEAVFLLFSGLSFIFRGPTDELNKSIEFIKTEVLGKLTTEETLNNLMADGNLNIDLYYYNKMKDFSFDKKSKEIATLYKYYLDLVYYISSSKIKDQVIKSIVNKIRINEG